LGLDTSGRRSIYSWYMKKAELLDFLQKHRLGVLATVSPNGDPEAAVVGIAVTDRLELVFDTLDTTRKCHNLRNHANIALVIGWDEEMTVQVEGIADEPAGAELDRLKTTYFAVYPDGESRQSWSGITYFRVRPTWARYSDFHDGMVVEFTAAQWNG
jgi:pyridoxine/pyridoxamine 5'-phosphate oxidase